MCLFWFLIKMPACFNGVISRKMTEICFLASIADRHGHLRNEKRSESDLFSEAGMNRQPMRRACGRKGCGTRGSKDQFYSVLPLPYGRCNSFSWILKRRVWLGSPGQNHATVISLKGCDRTDGFGVSASMHPTIGKGQRLDYLACCRAPRQGRSRCQVMGSGLGLDG